MLCDGPVCRVPESPKCYLQLSSFAHGLPRPHNPKSSEPKSQKCATRSYEDQTSDGNGARPSCKTSQDLMIFHPITHLAAAKLTPPFICLQSQACTSRRQEVQQRAEAEQAALQSEKSSLHAPLCRSTLSGSHRVHQKPIDQTVLKEFFERERGPWRPDYHLRFSEVPNTTGPFASGLWLGAFATLGSPCQKSFHKLWQDQLERKTAEAAAKIERCPAELWRLKHPSGGRPRISLSKPPKL